jgi:AbrB family looped-hinge helix DNA binding protein
MVRSKAKITSKGQITLPAQVRKALNVRAGDVVAFDIETDRVTVHSDLPPDRFAKFVGKYRVGRGQTAGEVRRWVHDIRGREGDEE